jgi:hypothetical protein
MAIHFYLHVDGDKFCVGKLVDGWPFEFYTHPGASDYASWAARIGRGEIRTDRGTEVRPSDLLAFVADAQANAGRVASMLDRDGYWFRSVEGVG